MNSDVLWDYNGFVKFFRENETISQNITFLNAIRLCLRELYYGDWNFRRVLVDGFMYSKDYKFLLDLSLPKYDSLEAMRCKIDEVCLLLGVEL